jgi:CobQ/CobB/MinD/ParA nucleotide binding domain
MPSSAKRVGQVITFYSYKGGTGRSFLLANVAFLLACQGHRVCMLDFDMEAPGLHRYFRPFLEDPDLEISEGLVDWLWLTADLQMQARSSSSDHPPPSLSDYAISLRRQRWAFPHEGELFLIPAGRQDGDYGKRVTSFDWAAYYDRLGGGLILDQARVALTKEFDWVFVDSRTGVSDTAGICTITFPDRLVACYTLNRQSIEGVDQTLARVVAQRGARPLTILPIETRIETNEKEKLDAARGFSRPRLGRYISGGADRRYWDDMEVVYWPFYAFEESLAVFAEDPGVQTKLSMLESTRRIAGRVAVGPGEPPMTLELPLVEPDVRAEIMAQYRWNEEATAGGQIAMAAAFAEALARFRAYEREPGRDRLMTATALRQLDEAGAMPLTLSGNEAFMSFLLSSRDAAERRFQALRRAVTVAVTMGLTVIASLAAVGNHYWLAGVGALIAALVSGGALLVSDPASRRSGRKRMNGPPT